MCLRRPDKKLALRQHDLLILPWLQTGCTVLDKHLETTVTHSDQRVVKRMKQAPGHFLAKCIANAMMHYRTMEANTIQLDELRKVSTLTYSGLLRPRRRFNNLGYISLHTWLNPIRPPGLSSPFFQIDIIRATVIVQRVRGKIIRLCSIVCNSAMLVSDIAIFVLKRDVKLQLTN